MNASETLQEKLASGEATVGIIGLGYVGLPLAHAVLGAGLRVLGVDVDEAKIDALERGESYLPHLGAELFTDLARSDRFAATTDNARLGEADVVVVCVPTPLGVHQEPELRYVLDAARAIGRTLRPAQLLVLESTTYPGTTRNDFLPAVLEAAGDKGRRLVPGRDFFAAFSPEREDPGRKSHTTRSIPKLVGGIDDASTAIALAFYSRVVDHALAVESAEIAEAAKLLENVFRAVNIALVNELKVVLGEMGIDVWKVIGAAATKPFGFMPFYPGPGLGGHCIPIDPFYLTWKAKEIGRPTRFIELAGIVNTEMPAYVVERVSHALNGAGKAVKGSRILVLGLAYKKDIADTRESPSFDLIERLRALGAEVSYSDPHIPRTVPVRKHDLRMSSVPLNPDSVASFDLVLVATDHSSFDYGLIADHARMVVDTRNAMRDHAARMGARLVLA